MISKQAAWLSSCFRGRHPSIFTVPTKTPLGKPSTSIFSKLLGDPGFLCWFHPVQPGIDANSLSEMRSLGPDLNGLVSKQDQLCPGLSNAQGSHTGLQATPWEISQRRRIERMYAFSSDVRACPLGIECHFSRQPRQQVAVPC